MRKIVVIEATDHDGFLFSLEINTVEYADLLKFVDQDMTWQWYSEWLDGIKQAIDQLKSGYNMKNNIKIKAYLKVRR